MMLQRKLAVCTLDFLIAGGARNAEHLVVISLCTQVFIIPSLKP